MHSACSLLTFLPSLLLQEVKQDVHAELLHASTNNNGVVPDREEVKR